MAYLQSKILPKSLKQELKLRLPGQKHSRKTLLLRTFASDYEPGDRTFEFCRARQLKQSIGDFHARNPCFVSDVLPTFCHLPSITVRESVSDTPVRKPLCGGQRNKTSGSVDRDVKLKPIFIQRLFTFSD